ncbi:MAG: hypothetical protein Q7T93_02220 [Methylobacterium sp.]|uniref:hypothetical protein n=1 Tax=Methylobacterium sp. TaxID=409 RepID=UPI002725C070|nr:hypothetical protein [Methylobacterium sp.]MDO9425624.1 hypothetical protein [Methylobacterium sp.]
MPNLIALTDILEYHVDTEASLRLYYSSSHPSYQARFTGYFPSEVLSELNERLSETEMRSALVMLARIEAAFRVDYRARATSKSADPISVRFRKLHASKGDRARLEDDILEVWRQYLDPADRAVISQLRGMLKYRHWLAHGRYWNPGAQHTFDNVYLLADVILTGFGLQGR